jgi:predicted small secreted protein
MTKRLLMLCAAALLLLFTTTACNTVRGAGEDVQSVGEAVTDNTPP